MDIEAQLTQRIQPVLPADITATFAVVAAGSRLAAFELAHGQVRFDLALQPDVTFFFDTADTALAVLTGADDPVAAFMDGRFRSDGHLLLAFVLLGLFTPGAGMTPPP